MVIMTALLARIPLPLPLPIELRADESAGCSPTCSF